MSRLKFGDTVRKNYGDMCVDAGVVGTVLWVNRDGSCVTVHWPGYYGKDEYSSDLTLLPPLPIPPVPQKKEDPPVETKPAFERLDQNFFDVTRRYTEKAIKPSETMCREALSLYRAPAMLDALEAAYAHIDELEGKITAGLTLADEWEEGYGMGSRAEDVYGKQVVSIDYAVEKIRSALGEA